MFRTAEVGRAVKRKEFEAIQPVLRTELVEVQQALRRASFPVIVLFAGVDGAGKSETVNLLNAWMDPRWVDTRAYGAPSDEERERPEFWRYWRDLPGHGRIGLFLSAWYSRPLVDRAYGRIDDPELDRRLSRIVAFEQLLADDGALILKFWMHLDKARQRKRLKALEKDPLQSWRVGETDWENFKRYHRFIAGAEHVIRRTSTGDAPWRIIEGADHYYRSLTVATTLRDAIRSQLDRPATTAAATAPTPAPGVRQDDDATTEVGILLDSVRDRTVLSRLATDLTVAKKDYASRLPEAQARVHAAVRAAKDRGVSTVLVFEGWDAAGKGGTIHRLTAALDARDFRVIPIAAPTDEERAHNYLWRFWRHLSRSGRVTIFDRSWYGRVLVERVEGFASEAEWRRAYAEINDFESQLVEHGVVLAKFWLHITDDEQLRRFQQREQLAYKRWKLTDEDWRNREKWIPYERAVHRMVEQTSTLLSPWTLVEANCKRHARLKVLDTVADRLERALDGKAG